MLFNREDQRFKRASNSLHMKVARRREEIVVAENTTQYGTFKVQKKSGVSIQNGDETKCENDSEGRQYAPHYVM